MTVLEIVSCKHGGSGCCWLYNDKVPFLMTIWNFFFFCFYFPLFTSFPHFPPYKWVYTRRHTFLPRHISGFFRTNLFVKCKFSTTEINDNILSVVSFCCCGLFLLSSALRMSSPFTVLNTECKWWCLAVLFSFFFCFFLFLRSKSF